MRKEDYDLNVVQGGTGVGTARTCGELVDKWVQVFGIAGGCVIRIEGTIDGTHYVTSGANITADGVYEIPEAFLKVQVNRTATGTGNPTVKLTGRQARSE